MICFLSMRLYFKCTCKSFMLIDTEVYEIMIFTGGAINEPPGPEVFKTFFVLNSPELEI